MTKSAQKTYTITVSGMTGAKLFEEDTIMKNNSSIKTVVAVGIGSSTVLCTWTLCCNTEPGTEHKYQSSVCSTCTSGYYVWTGCRRTDRVYRPRTD